MRKHVSKQEKQFLEMLQSKFPLVNMYDKNLFGYEMACHPDFKYTIPFFIKRVEWKETIYTTLKFPLKK